MADRFDVIVIGGGWGGYSAAVRAAQHGRAVALVERDLLGGTCLHRGCIPTKVFLQTADLLDAARRAGEFGVVLPAPSLDFARVQARKAAVVEQQYRGLHSAVRASGVTIISATARLLSATRVALDNGTELEADSLVLATGSRPRPLPGLPFDGHSIISSDDALELADVPASIAILGAGAVGVEFASCFADYGARVTLLELAPRITPLEDREVSAVLDKSLRARGIAVRTDTALLPDSVRADDEGVRCTVRQGEQEETLHVDVLLVAVGRQAVTEGLGLEAAGVRVERGVVPVDAAMQTSVPGVYAVGDLNGGLLLAHVAAAEGTLAADVIAGQPYAPLDYHRLPRATYCRPQVASIGYTEDEAKARGHDTRVGRAHFRINGKALIAGEPEGFVKLVADAATGDVLGVHLIGHGVTEMIGELALGQLLDVAVWEIAATVHPHPTVSEAIGEAAQRALTPARTLGRTAAQPASTTADSAPARS